MKNHEHINSLDGLRTLAVFLVILRHWHLKYLNLEAGWVGVNLFFVLSGFLITSILQRDKSLPLGKYLKNFYMKRSLRIFPIYYLYLLLCIILLVFCFSFFGFQRFQSLQAASGILRENTWALLTYTYNFHDLVSFFHGTTEPGSKFFGHLWSLGIEEQFYLVFPFIVYLLNKRTLKYLMFLVIIASPFLRAFAGYYLKTHGGDPFQAGLIVYKTTFFQLDALAFGAVLGLTGWQNIKWSGKILLLLFAAILAFNLFTVYLLRNAGAAVSWSSLGFDLAANQATYHTGIFLLDIKYAYTFTLLNILSLILLVFALRSNFFSAILRLKPLTWIGKMSYGVYLYHNPFFEIFLLLLAGLGLSTQPAGFMSELIYFIAYIALVLFISYMSYRFIETPFLKMKEKFNR